MVCGSKKNRDHPDTSTPTTADFISQGKSASPTVMSTPSDAIFHTPVRHPFILLLSSRPTPLPSARLPAAPTQGMIESHIIILPTAGRLMQVLGRSRTEQRTYGRKSSGICCCKKGIDGTRCISVPHGMLRRNKPHYMLTKRSRRWHRGTVYRAVVVRGPVKYQELKANAERLHIETRSPMLTDEQLMFEATGGSNKGHVYSFG
ncbi:hypothetical protein M9H77_08605 [Catharanthus roseus]|uniref:Uncharacterized protein n=1 Tax=Catharanthus roseus TaxID=4058 RepID=A0ACC0BYF0_CATRO|nr:hypothetical protein M9H77_08605 [Catharanthus roseus]